ncbi:MAG: lamin tail domain-containing protein [Candidatus Vogelbacteria bacterium]|nr:lamin tail domain-containing protein [Candidatus Vogelbacteria bacterium]
MFGYCCKKLCITLSLALFSALPFQSMAYQPETTHAGLTQEVVAFYNSTHARGLNDAVKETIIQGSIDEDRPAVRALNHFYDPIRNMGINGARTSKSWALDNLPENEFSWPKAIQYYAEGDEAKAYLALGHIIHLLEDLTVPDHTRNDPHVGDGPAGLYTNESPYESWTDNNKDRNSLKNLAAVLFSEGNQKKVFLTLSDYFDFLANYSNNNFFSKDTINSEIYKRPVAIEYDDVYAYGEDFLMGDKFKLLNVTFDLKGVKKYSLMVDNDTSVLSGYFDRLGKQAILAGAGVIDLFFKEATRAREEYRAKKEEERKRAVLEAIALDKRLSSAGIFSTIVQGTGFFVQDKIVTPAINTAKGVATSFGNGSLIAYSEATNAGSFVLYTTKSLATMAINSGVAAASSAIDNISVAIKSLVGRNQPAAVFVTAESAVDNKNNTGNAELSMSLSDLLLRKSEVPASPAGRRPPEIAVPVNRPIFPEVRPPETIPVAGAEPIKIAAQEAHRPIMVSVPNISFVTIPAVEPITQALAPIYYSGGSIGSAAQFPVVPVAQVVVSSILSQEASQQTLSNSQTQAATITTETVATSTSALLAEELVMDTATSTEAIIEPVLVTVTPPTPIVPNLSFSIPACAPLDCTFSSELGNVILNWGSTSTDLSFYLLDTSGFLTKFSSTTLSTNVNIPVGESRAFSLASYSVSGLHSATSTKSVSISLPPPMPVTSPDLTFSIPECGGSISLGSCLLMNPTITLNWSSIASGVDFYLLNNSGDLTKFSSTTLSATINIENDSSRQLSLAAYAVGSPVENTIGQASSATSTKSVYVSASPVVINEVAWGGTASHPEDEWIELYNRSPYDVDLFRFTLYSKTDMDPYLKLSGAIPSHGYYLIERKNDGETSEDTQSPIKDISADLWASFGGGLNNNGENLILSVASSGTSNQATTTVDEIAFCNKWCGANSSYSYERYNPDLAGASSSNWSSNYGLIINGKNVSGASVIGTPKARNSLNYLLNRNEDINSDLTLKKVGSPYVVDDRTLQISSGKTLTIEPGVVVKFNKAAKVKASGNIIANGMADNKIVFTAFADDTYGGDTDGVLVAPAKGTWFGVELYSGSGGSSFDNTVWRYGGNYGTGLYKKAMLYVENVSPPISDSIFEYSKAYGLYINKSSSPVSGNIFRFNTGTTFSAGAYAEDGTGGYITNNQFTDNATGLSIVGFKGDVKDNIFTNNAVSAFSLSGPLVGAVSGNSGSGNVSDTINLQGGDFTCWCDHYPCREYFALLSVRDRFRAGVFRSFS